MSFGVPLVILPAAVGAALILSAIVVACTVRSGRARALMALLTAVFSITAGSAFVAFFPELVDKRFQTYRAFYRDIQVGMTREQVLAVLERRYPADGPRKRPEIMDDTPTRLGFFMNPEASLEPNCKGIFLTLQGGRVVQIAYSGD